MDAPGPFFFLVRYGAVSSELLTPLCERLPPERYVSTPARGGEAYDSTRWPLAGDAALARALARRFADGEVAQALGELEAAAGDPERLRALARRGAARLFAASGVEASMFPQWWSDATADDLALFEEPPWEPRVAGIVAELCAAHHAAADGLYAFHVHRRLPGPSAEAVAQLARRALAEERIDARGLVDVALALVSELPSGARPDSEARGEDDERVDAAAVASELTAASTSTRSDSETPGEAHERVDVAVATSEQSFTAASTPTRSDSETHGETHERVDVAVAASERSFTAASTPTRSDSEERVDVAVATSEQSFTAAPARSDSDVRVDAAPVSPVEVRHAPHFAVAPSPAAGAMIDALVDACADVGRVAGATSITLMSETFAIPALPPSVGFMITAGPRALLMLGFSAVPAWTSRISEFRGRPLRTRIGASGRFELVLSESEREEDRAPAAVAALRFFVEVALDAHVAGHPEDEPVFPFVDDAMLERLFG